ncbi:MAG: type II secretion system F family protein [Fuerstiella sp.]
MSIGFIHTQLFLFNKPEPLRQSTLLMALATSLGDGQAVMASLQALVADAKGTWKTKLQRLMYLMQDGSTLSEACTAVRDIVPERTKMAIRVAENSGALKQVLADEANLLMQQGRQNSARPKPLGLFVSLLVLSLSTLFVISFVLIFIVPKFRDIFENFAVPFPAATKQLIQISNVFLQFWWLLILPVFTFIVYTLGYSTWCNWKYLTRGSLPFVRSWPRFWAPDILKSLAVAIASDRPIPEPIHVMLSEMPPGKAATALSAVRQKAQNGDDVWNALQTTGFLKRSETKLIQAAEAAGNLDWAVLQLAADIRRRRQTRMQTWVTLLQPISVLLMGLLIGFIVYALYMPIASLPLTELGKGI